MPPALFLDILLNNPCNQPHCHVPIRINLSHHEADFIGSLMGMDVVDKGILKNLGFTSAKLQRLWYLQYFVPILAGMAFGLPLVILAGFLVCSATLTAIVDMVLAKMPFLWWAFCALAILLSLMGLVLWRTGKVGKVTPMKAAGISNFISHLGVGDILLPDSVVILLFFGFVWILSGKIKKASLRVLVTE